jgi:hypothetical protein
MRGTAINRLATRPNQPLADTRDFLAGDDYEAEPEEPRRGLLPALIAVLGAAVILAALPVAAGLSMLFGVPAPSAFGVGLIALGVLCFVLAITAVGIVIRLTKRSRGS